jgi:hypothetical protein
MAIAYDNGGAGTAGSGNFTQSFTVSSSANRFLFVFCFDTGTSSSPNVTGITYAGTSLTKQTVLYDSSIAAYDIYYMYAPASGANNLVISYSTSQPTRAVWTSYTGVKQSGFPDASSAVWDVPATTSTATLTCTPVAAGAWGILGIAMGSASPTTNYTTRENQNSRIISDTNGTISGSTSMTATNSSNNDGLGQMFTIAPFVAVTANGQFLQFM